MTMTRRCCRWILRSGLIAAIRQGCAQKPHPAAGFRCIMRLELRRRRRRRHCILSEPEEGHARRATATGSTRLAADEAACPAYPYRRFRLDSGNPSPGTAGDIQIQQGWEEQTQTKNGKYHDTPHISRSHLPRKSDHPDFLPFRYRRACDKFVGDRSADRTGLPEFLPTATELATSQRDNGISASNRPMHA